MSSITCLNGCKQLNNSCQNNDMHNLPFAHCHFLFPFCFSFQAAIHFCYINESNYYIQTQQQNRSSSSMSSFLSDSWSAAVLKFEICVWCTSALDGVCSVVMEIAELSSKKTGLQMKYSPYGGKDSVMWIEESASKWTLTKVLFSRYSNVCVFSLGNFSVPKVVFIF